MKLRLTKEQRKAFKKIASMGGRASASAKTPEQRRAQAIKAITTRWARVKAAQAPEAQV